MDEKKDGQKGGSDRLYDREDAIYAGSVLLIAVGAALFHPGAGLICAGSGIALPYVVMFFRGQPTQRNDR